MMGNTVDAKGRPRGYALVAVLLVTSILFFIGAGAFRMIQSETLMTDSYSDSVAAYYLAEGGVQRTLWMLRRDPSFGSDKKWRTFPLGEGTYMVQIVPGEDDIINITVQGSFRKTKVQLAARAKVFVEILEPEEPEYGEPRECVQVQLVWFEDKTLP